MSTLIFDDLIARAIFLDPGDVRYGYQGEVFGTLLGSCVAIILWHPVRRFGSICHFVLPAGRADADVPGKYGSGAFEQQKKDLLRHDVNIRQCVVKIIGGGKMFAHSDTQGIGTKNINMAKELVAQEGLAVTAEDVGNAGYRRLYFDVDSGAVWIKFDWLDGGQEDRMI